MASIPERVDEEFWPNQTEERILELLVDGRDRGEPWGVVTPLLVRERLGLDRHEADYYLGNLVDAGWVEKPVDGVYRLVCDPRDDYFDSDSD